MAERRSASQRKFAKVIREFTSGSLKSSSGKRVTSLAQAQAIAASESGISRFIKKKTTKKKRKKKKKRS